MSRYLDAVAAQEDGSASGGGGGGSGGASAAAGTGAASAPAPTRAPTKAELSELTVAARCAYMAVQDLCLLERAASPRRAARFRAP